MCGSSQRRNGTRKREVCSADKTSVEPIKITPSQMATGNQYLRNARMRSGRHVACELNNAAGTRRRNALWRGERLPLQFLKSQHEPAQSHISPHLRTDFHGAYLGRPKARSALSQTITKGNADWRIMGDCRSSGSTKSCPRSSDARSDSAPALDGRSRGDFWRCSRYRTLSSCRKIDRCA